MTNIRELRSEIGLINESNAARYFDEFMNVAEWDENLALEWIQIFSETDDNDYTGLAWDIVQMFDNKVSPIGIQKLKSINSYWANVASHGK